MSQEDRESIGHYKAVARGWWYVGAGAWFIFLKEAWELAEHQEWTAHGLLGHGRADDDGGPRRRRRGR